MTCDASDQAMSKLSQGFEKKRGISLVCGQLSIK